jgi:hypothetical protein
LRITVEISVAYLEEIIDNSLGELRKKEFVFLPLPSNLCGAQSNCLGGGDLRSSNLKAAQAKS